MKKKNFIIVILLLILLFLVFLFFRQKTKSKAINTNNSSITNTSNENSSTTTGNSVTMNGWLRCLPHKTRGVLCVIGIENSDNQIYGLIKQNGKLLDPTQLTTGSRYKVTGNYVATPNSLQAYKIQGTIKLK